MWEWNLFFCQELHLVGIYVCIHSCDLKYDRNDLCFLWDVISYTAIIPHLEAIHFDLDGLISVLHSIGGGAFIMLYILMADGCV